MREDGFTYIEALLSLVLFAIFVLVIQATLYTTMRERAERMAETQGQLLACSLLEQWKAGHTIDAGERENGGKRYRIRITPVRVTEMVEKCEVQVLWESEWTGERRIGFTGYRFTPAVSATPGE
jgi:Tfp pilus assembly protein PilV